MYHIRRIQGPPLRRLFAMHTGHRWHARLSKMADRESMKPSIALPCPSTLGFFFFILLVVRQLYSYFSEFIQFDSEMLLPFMKLLLVGNIMGHLGSYEIKDPVSSRRRRSFERCSHLIYCGIKKCSVHAVTIEEQFTDIPR